MMTYMHRTIIISTIKGEKEVVRNVRMIRGRIAAIRYKRSLEHVTCSGNPKDVTAKWQVRF